MQKNDERSESWALCRYKVISAYLALAPKRGERRLLLEQLAQRPWSDPEGEPLVVAAETIRVWLRRYRRGGLKALANKKRSDHKQRRVLSPELEAAACALKREVPARSLERIITIMEALKMCEPGVIRRSTLHRALQRQGISARHATTPDSQDLDRFEANLPNDLWQSDMLFGPWLDLPNGKRKRAKFFAFIDDHSRKLLYGRFAFSEGLPSLELVFRRSLQRFGVPKRVYYDNGQVYRSHHMKQVAGELGIHRQIFTTAHRPMGHGKIEAFNRHLRSAFLSEFAVTKDRSLDALNETFQAWAELEYNQRVHSETGQSPDERWRAGLEKFRYADEGAMREAFTWREKRTPDKAGVFSLFGTRYQIHSRWAKKRLEVRYDPEGLEQVELFYKGEFLQRCRPLEIRDKRRPKVRSELNHSTPQEKIPTADWLTHLVKKHRKDVGKTESPATQSVTLAQKRQLADEAVRKLLHERLDPVVLDEEAITKWLQKYGPFSPELVLEILDQIEPKDHHLEYYFEAILKRRSENTGLEGEPKRDL